MTESQTAIGVTSIDHISLLVDPQVLPQEVEFFRLYFGFLCIEHPFADTCGLDIRWLEMPDGRELHLFTGKAPTLCIDGNKSENHFAVAVADIQRAREIFREGGIEVIEINDTMPMPGRDRFYVYSPGKNLVEIMAACKAV